MKTLTTAIVAAAFATSACAFSDPLLEGPAPAPQRVNCEQWHPESKTIMQAAAILKQQWGEDPAMNLPLPNEMDMTIFFDAVDESWTMVLVYRDQCALAINDGFGLDTLHNALVEFSGIVEESV